LDLTGENRVEQGATFEIAITVKDSAGAVYDLAASTCTAQIRETKASATAIDFTASINTTTGVITLTLSATVTAAITFTSGFWDCEILTGAVVVRLLEGSVEISQEVTK
jgi:hypothetical protein